MKREDSPIDRKEKILTLKQTIPERRMIISLTNEAYTNVVEAVRQIKMSHIEASVVSLSRTEEIIRDLKQLLDEPKADEED
jgi:flagellin-specific chaperone FliS